MWGFIARGKSPTFLITTSREEARQKLDGLTQVNSRRLRYSRLLEVAIYDSMGNGQEHHCTPDKEMEINYIPFLGHQAPE